MRQHDTLTPDTSVLSQTVVSQESSCHKDVFLCKVLKFVRELVSWKCVFREEYLHTTSQCSRAFPWACWNFHAVPEYVTHLALARLCVLSRGVPRSFVLQVLAMQFDISSPTWQRKYHMLNLHIRTVSQVNRVVLSSLLTRHAVLEDRHVDPDTEPESGSLAAA